MQKEAWKGNIVALEYEAKEAEQAAGYALKDYIAARAAALKALRSRQDFIDARDQGILGAGDEDLNVTTVLDLEEAKEVLAEARRTYVLAEQTFQELRTKLDYARSKRDKVSGEANVDLGSNEEK